MNKAKDVKSRVDMVRKKVDKFMKTADEDKIIGRTVLLAHKIEDEDVDAMIELVIITAYMEDEK